MQVNRVLLDILDWIRKLVWWREHKIPKRPYEILSIENTLFGLLKKVTRDTPRALSTYILTPIAPPKYSKEKHYDYHLCLDHLWSLDSINNEVNSNQYKLYNIDELRYRKQHSHCVTILKASRWVNKEGEYNSQVMFQGYYDFIGYNAYWNNRDRWAYSIFNDLIRAIKTKDISILNFNDIIENGRRKYLGMSASKIESIHYSYDLDDRAI